MAPTRSIPPPCVEVCGHVRWYDDVDSGPAGALGEQLAVEHLTGLGLRILSRNWRCRYGELDVIATDPVSRTTINAVQRRFLSLRATARSRFLPCSSTSSIAPLPGKREIGETGDLRREGNGHRPLCCCVKEAITQ